MPLLCLNWRQAHRVRHIDGCCTSQTSSSLHVALTLAKGVAVGQCPVASHKACPALQSCSHLVSCIKQPPPKTFGFIKMHGQPLWQLATLSPQLSALHCPLFIRNATPAIPTATNAVFIVVVAIILTDFAVVAIARPPLTWSLRDVTESLTTREQAGFFVCVEGPP